MCTMSIASQNALVGRSYTTLAFHFPYDESFEEIEEDLDVPAHEGHAIYEEIIRDRAGSDDFTKLLACAAMSL